MTDIHAEKNDTKVSSDANLPNGNTGDVGEKDDVIAKNKEALNRTASCASILQSNGLNKMKNLSRRVSFPSDDKLISGYNEPRNPWEHAHETTTEDLIQAYTQACQSWNVKPITKLLLQLQEIKDFTVRANSLTLKGEKLETRVVETLESIFKRVQFITIDLEATSLDEEAAASLFDMIEYYESAVNVLVGFNKNLGNRGWQAAAHMMRKMSCLRLFDGHSVPLSIQAAPFVGRALRLSNTLVTLHLENAYLSARPLLLIVAALKMNTTLRELFLADNELGAMDALQIANLLKFNRILQLLDLRNNPIQDIGLGHLSAGLMAQANSSGLNGPVGGLQTLVLWNNQITHDGMLKLASALRHTVSLATLNLGQNSIGDDGMLCLKEGLLQNHSLLRLGLVGTKLTDEGAVAVAEYLAESPRIIRLDLRNNDIKVAGLMALSLAFKINNSLLRLDIDKPNKRDSLKELAMKQESLMADIISYAARNKEAALVKVHTAAARQEEEAQKATEQAKEQTGLRYMDMTNTSTPSSVSQSGQTCSNNSNNQPRLEQSPNQLVEGASKLPTVTRDVDDTPEDSPEFLPRNSVPYHQVAPVMLSNSEIAKRAAAAKIHPVQVASIGTSRFQIKPVFNTPKEGISSALSQNQPLDSSGYEEISNSTEIPDAGDHAPVTMATQNSDVGLLNEVSAGDGGHQQKPGEHTENILASSLQVKSASTFYGPKVNAVNQESEKRRENLEIFAEQLINTVLQKDGSTASALDADPSNCHDPVQARQTASKIHEVASPSLEQHHCDVSSLESDPASNEIQNLVALATESASPNDGVVKQTLSVSSMLTTDEIPSLVAKKPNTQTSSEPAMHRVLSPDCSQERCQVPSEELASACKTNTTSSNSEQTSEQGYVPIGPSQELHCQDALKESKIDSEHSSMQYQEDASIKHQEQAIKPLILSHSVEPQVLDSASIRNQIHTGNSTVLTRPTEEAASSGPPQSVSQTSDFLPANLSETARKSSNCNNFPDNVKLDIQEDSSTVNTSVEDTVTSANEGNCDNIDNSSNVSAELKQTALSCNKTVMSENLTDSEQQMEVLPIKTAFVDPEISANSLKEEIFVGSVTETGSPESPDVSTQSTITTNQPSVSSDTSSTVINKVNINQMNDYGDLKMTQHIQYEDVTISTNAISEVDTVSQRDDIEENVEQNNTVTCSPVPSDQEISSDVASIEENVAGCAAAQCTSDGTEFDVVAEPETVPASQEEISTTSEQQVTNNDPQLSICESGFDTTTDDNSLLSGELSPMEGKQSILEPAKNADLLTPDSGVVNFITKGEDIAERMYHDDAVSDNHDLTITDSKFDPLLKKLDDQSSGKLK